MRPAQVLDAQADILARCWVGDHIRGPEGAPIAHTEKVYALHR